MYLMANADVLLYFGPWPFTITSYSKPKWRIDCEQIFIGLTDSPVLDALRPPSIPSRYSVKHLHYFSDSLG